MLSSCSDSCKPMLLLLTFSQASGSLPLVGWSPDPTPAWLECYAFFLIPHFHLFSLLSFLYSSYPMAQHSLRHSGLPITFRPSTIALFQILQTLCLAPIHPLGTHLSPHLLLWDFLLDLNIGLGALTLFPWHLVSICSLVDLIQLYC